MIDIIDTENLSPKDLQCIESDYDCSNCPFRYTGDDVPFDEDLCVYDME